MKKTLVFIHIFLFLLVSAGEAFVPKTPHLLYLVIEKIRQPIGIEAFQSKKIIDYNDETQGYIQINEKLRYAFPNHFRSDITAGPMSGFSLQSQDQYVKVIDKTIVAVEEPVLDAYSDILLYRDYQTLTRHLEAVGVNTDKVTLKRYKDTMCYVIGTPAEKNKPYSGLWVQKDTFFPLKYVLVKDGWVVEFYYDTWQRRSKTWYPMQTSIFLDNQLYAMVNVADFGLKKIEPDSLFDVDMVKRSFPLRRTGESVDDTSSGVDELQESINDFKKLFE